MKAGDGGEEAELRPADIEAWRRRREGVRSPEAPDVVPPEGAARAGEAQARPERPRHAAEGGLGVTRPVNGVALRTRGRRAREDEAGPRGGAGRLEDGAVVEERVAVVHARAGLAAREAGLGGDRLPVVGLEAGDPQIEERAVLRGPPRRRLRVREVDDGGVGIDGGRRRLALRGGGEEAARLALRERVAVARHVGVLPEGEPHPPRSQPDDEAARIGKRFLVPDEVARVEHPGRAAAEPERVDMDDVERQVSRAHPLDDRLHLGAVPVHAARHPDAERPAGRKGRPSRESGVPLDDGAWVAEEDEVVHLGRRHREAERHAREGAAIDHGTLGPVEEAAIAPAREPEWHGFVGEVGRVEAEGVRGPEEAPSAAEVEAVIGLAEADEGFVGRESECLVHARRPVRIRPVARGRRHPPEHRPVEHLLGESLLPALVGDGDPERLRADAHP